MRKKLNCIMIVFTIISLFLLCSNIIKEKRITNEFFIQKNISSKLIRFHVIGNSNSSYDQTLKIKIKDTVVSWLKPKLNNINNISDARTIIKNNISNINVLVSEKLKQYNSSYSVTTSICIRHFPLKQYGEMFLPEGEYESVCINLGEAKGRNWWCVLYPTLCFVDCTYSVLPDNSKNKLKTALSPTEYNYIMNQENTDINYDFAFKKFFKTFFPF